jgi:hypothetical protein
MKNKLLYLIFCCLPVVSFGQYEKMLETMENEMETLESGKLVIRLINAETGGPVDSATISIEGIGKFTSDGRGRVLINPANDKTYSMSFSKKGFISATYDLEIVAGTIFNNHFSVSPLFEFGALRVVLDWGKNPADLDAHLVKEGDYHISYQNMKLSADGSARLDRDDRQGFGPETITVKQVDNKAVYVCYIKNFTNSRSPKSKALSKSSAKVRLYRDNTLIKTYSVPTDKKGTTWRVFTIENGKIVDQNQFGNWY